MEGKTDADLKKLVENNFDLRPGMLILNLKLDQPIYKKTTLFGHFMPKSDGDLPWEVVKDLK